MTLVDNFHLALASSAADLPGPALLPERLARACAEVLPVDGAGIGLFFGSGRRLPLGASDPLSAEAERIQFTVGEGPCLTCHATDDPEVADATTMFPRWPGYVDALLGRTPIRGTLSLPLSGELQGIGALDLYVVPPHETATVSLADARTIGEQVTAVLQAQGRPPRACPDGPAWLDAPAAQRRSRVWQAIGMVNGALRVPSPDALALLRARAFAGGYCVDELAAQLVSGEVPVEGLALDPDRPW